MSNLKIVMFVFSLFLVSMAFGEGKKFKINGWAPELSEGEMLVIVNRLDGVDTLAQAPLVNGKFVLEGELEKPCVALIKVAQYNGGFIFLLDTDAPYEMRLWQDKKEEIKGGKLQGELNAYKEIVEKANKGMNKLKEEIGKASSEKHYKTAGELQKKLARMREDAQKELDALVEKNKDNIFAAYIQTIGMEQMNLEALKACYQRLSEKARQLEPGKQVAARIQALEGVEVNAIAPNFTLRTPEGKEVAMYDVKGEIKIIDFWASWCGPCRLENPNMVKLYQDFKDKGLAVMSVSLDEKKDKWIEAIQKDGLTWLHLSDLKGWKGEIVKLYNIDGVPTIFVLDENNRIIAKNLRGEKLRAFVEERLK